MLLQLEWVFDSKLQLLLCSSSAFCFHFFSSLFTAVRVFTFIQGESVLFFSIFRNFISFSNGLHVCKIKTVLQIYCRSKKTDFLNKCYVIFFRKVVSLLTLVWAISIFPPKDLEKIRALKIRMRRFFLIFPQFFL